MSNQANFTQNARQTESLNNLNSNLVLQKASQDATGTLLTGMKATQESIVAGINNPELADTTVGERSYVYAHDAVNSKARALKCDATGRLECSVDALEISADTINLNTDQLEGKIGETNSLLTARLPTLLTGSGNLKVSLQELGNEGSERLNTEANVAQLPSALTGEGNLKVSIQEDFTHNLATSAKQDDLITAVNATTTSINSRMASVVTANVDTKNSVNAVGLTSGATASNTASILAKNGEIETTLNSILQKNGEIENHLETISENQSTFASGDDVVISGGIVLPTALTGSGNLKVCLQELGNEGSERLNVDVGSTNTKLPSALSGAGNLKVSIQEGNISGFATASLQGGGLPSALSTNNLRVSLKETIDVPITNSHLTELGSAINSNRVDVNMADGHITGFSTETLQGGGLPSALSGDNLKVSLKETITVPSTVVKTTGEFLASGALGDDNFSSSLDCSSFRHIRLFGKLSAGLGPSETPVFGSQTDGGTYYKVGTLTRDDVAISGITQLHLTAKIEMVPNFIKIYNNSGSSLTLELDYIGFSC